MCVIAKTIHTLSQKREITMAAKTQMQVETETKLRGIFKGMDAHQAQEIREAYYKALEGLMTLSQALEIADAKQTPSAGPLLDEHYLAVQALDALKHSRLGAVL